MDQSKLFLKIMILFWIAVLLVGCNQETETLEEAALIEDSPTETQIQPTPTAIPPTETEIPPAETKVPPTDTKAPPTKTPTTEPPKNLSEMAFTQSDLIGIWVSDKQTNSKISFEENGKSKLYRNGVLVGKIAYYKLQGNVCSHTLSDCIKVVGGTVQEFTCSAEYKITYYQDEDSQIYLSFELIGEDEHSFRRMMFGSGSLWVKD